MGEMTDLRISELAVSPLSRRLPVGPWASPFSSSGFRAKEFTCHEGALGAKFFTRMLSSNP